MSGGGIGPAEPTPTPTPDLAEPTPAPSARPGPISSAIANAASERDEPRADRPDRVGIDRDRRDGGRDGQA